VANCGFSLLGGWMMGWRCGLWVQQESLLWVPGPLDKVGRRAHWLGIPRLFSCLNFMHAFAT